MRSMLAALPFAAMTFLCWGVYGPVLHHGKAQMGNSSFRQLVCVGVAYFFIAVLVPVFILKTRGEKGRWSIGGTFWSLMAGICGAFGALGIINALQFGGQPLYVMPLVFGFAPVVNTLVSMWMTRTFREAGAGFFCAIALVAAGAAGVMWFQPGSADSNLMELGFQDAALILSSIAMTALCWGSYGSVLHKGQAKMGGSRLRPLLCVGLAYFAVAVVVPMIVLSFWTPTTDWNWTGAAWSLTAGACGAMGALGIILSFTVGGKPIFVMPLVFGGAPVVNTLVTVAEKRSFSELPLAFFVSLAIVISGAVMVLIFAPRPGGPPRKPQLDDKSF